MTSSTPDRPRATRPRRNSVQLAVSSLVTMSNPTISRRPSQFAAVAITAVTFTTRPPSRTFWVSPSIHKNRYGPASSGRSRNSATLASSSPAMRDTSEREIPSMPIALTRSSTRRVDTPSTYAWHTTSTVEIVVSEGTQLVTSPGKGL
jgi:hypothetical protein